MSLLYVNPCISRVIHTSNWFCQNHNWGGGGVGDTLGSSPIAAFGMGWGVVHKSSCLCSGDWLHCSSEHWQLLQAQACSAASLALLSYCIFYTEKKNPKIKKSHESNSTGTYLFTWIQDKVLSLPTPFNMEGVKVPHIGFKYRASKGHVAPMCLLSPPPPTAAYPQFFHGFNPGHKAHACSCSRPSLATAVTGVAAAPVRPLSLDWARTASTNTATRPDWGQEHPASQTIYPSPTCLSLIVVEGMNLRLWYTKCT